MRREDISLMRDLPLFRGVADAHVDALLQGAFLQRFPAAVELVEEGAPPDFLHVVIEGVVGMVASHGERETTVRVLSASESFVAAAVVLDTPYLVSARTLAPARLAMLPASGVRAAFEADAAFARAIAVEMAHGYRGMVKELKNQKLRTVLERLANWLLAYDAEFGESGQFTLPYDKRTLASQLGMAPEVLSRSFATLADHGVNMVGSSVMIVDRGRLAAVARPSPTIDDPDA
jgi:CRP/FNR family transcriptional activator FtrB